MPRPIQAVIHASALSHNLARARASARGAKVFAVVKANAYGHGIERVFNALGSADGFALLDIAEAQKVRALGWKGPVLLLEGCFESGDLHICSELDLWHSVHQERQIAWLTLHSTSRPHHVFVKLNSGMNRLGFAPRDFRAAWRMLERSPAVASVAAMTHFSDADGDRGIEDQLSIFEECAAGLHGVRTVSNSAALLRHHDRAGVPADWVRAGIMLYGGAPDYPQHDATHWGLQPGMTLRSELLAIQNLRAGDSVGYGSGFVAAAEMRIGIVACGYADGYPRHAPTGTPVLVNGVRCQTVGRVSMDMLAVDLSDAPSAVPGTEVTLWGRGPNSTLLAIDEVAHSAGTISYELMCALAPRVPVSVQA